MLNGVITYGLSIAIVSIIYRGFRQPSNGFFGQYCIIALIAYPIGGYIFGLWIWNGNEQEYLLRKDELTKSEEKYNNTE